MLMNLAVALVMASSMGLVLAEPELVLDDEGSGQGSDGDGSAQADQGGGLFGDQVDEHIASWVYISMPGHGTYSMREVLVEGSAGWDAFAAFGQAIEEFEPVKMFIPNASVNTTGIVVWMPIEQCPGDMDEDGDLDLQDLLIFAQAFADGDESADLNGDGQLNFDDQGVMFDALNDGCLSLEPVPA